MSFGTSVYEAMQIAPPSGIGGLPRESELASETRVDLIRRAKDIISGRTEPPALIPSPEIEQFLRSEFAGRQPPPTAEALSSIAERLCLEALYNGSPVACFTTRAGTVSVLASGDREIEGLLQGLSHEERASVVITDTGNF